jgi:hypothetical protein
MKCGTTSLYNYLQAHPDVVMSRIKEPSYFCHSYDEPLSWYHSLFPERGDAIIGEASTHYTKYPIHQGVPRRIHNVLPTARLIYLVRDPVERIVSQYVHERSRAEEDRPLSECLELDEKNPYIAYSCYALQMKQYRAYFDDAQLLVVDAENLKHNRRATLRQILDFIGVGSGLPEEKQLRQEANQSVGTTERMGIARTLAEISWLHSAYASIPSRIRSWMKPLYRSPVGKPDLRADERKRLYEYLRPQVEWLRQYADKPFNRWGV